MSKVSHQQGRTGHAAHNDRSMYPVGKYDISRNLHWDCTMQHDELRPAQLDAASVNAEADYYQQHYGQLLEERNQKYIKQRKAKQVLTMEQWKEKNQPHETIVQLGKLGDDTPEELKEAFAVEAAKMLRQSVLDAGGDVLSLDVHFDEASPHAHIRWVMNDAKGKPNVKGCLTAHGWAVDGEPDRRNNPMKKWTASNREKLEALAADMGADLDTERTSRPNMTVQEYKAAKQLEAARKAQDKARETIEKAEEEGENARRKHAQMVQGLNQDIAAKRSEKQQLEREIEERKANVERLEALEKSIKQRIAAILDDAEKRLASMMATVQDKAKSLKSKLGAVGAASNAIKASRSRVNTAQTRFQQQHMARAGSRQQSQSRQLQR